MMVTMLFVEVNAIGLAYLLILSLSRCSYEVSKQMVASLGVKAWVQHSTIHGYCPCQPVQISTLQCRKSHMCRVTSKARTTHDKEDTASLVEFLNAHNPFSGHESLRNIVRGVSAENVVNGEKSKKVGTKILNTMTGKTVTQHMLKRKDQGF